jgi:hypothetical protein
LGLGRVEGGSKVKLETLGDNVVNLDLRSEHVGGGPSLSMSTCKSLGMLAARRHSPFCHKTS